MKKTTKGAFAGGVALLLLLGTGGTLAYWNDTADLTGQNSIVAGNLAVTEQTDEPTWTIQHTDGSAAPVEDITELFIVPGDQLSYTAGFNVTAQGQNLKFTTGLTDSSITPASSAEPADVALASRLVDSAEFAVNGGTTTTPGTTFEIDHTDNIQGTYPITVTVTLTWPFGDGTSPALDNPAKLGQVDLSDFTLTVTQIDGN